jgi:hypothetical protein
MEPNDATQQDRRGFLRAGVAATTLAVAGLPSAAHGTTEATGKMKIENVGVMSPGDMGTIRTVCIFRIMRPHGNMGIGSCEN